MNEPNAIELVLVEDDPRDLELSPRGLRKTRLANRIKGDVHTSMIPIVILTSSKEQIDLAKSYRLGVNSYMVKPINFECFAEAATNLGLYWMVLNQPAKFSEQ